MPWWGWIISGAVLLCGELLIDGQFYLLFVGIAALLVGFGYLAGLTLPVWAQWTAFSVLSLVLLVGLRSRLYARIRATGAGGYDAVRGEIAIVRETIAAGEVGRAELRGAEWTARNVGPTALHPDQRAVVERVERLTLELREEY